MSFDLETSHSALGSKALQIYINDDPGLTMNYFMARSNVVAYVFDWEKLLHIYLLGNTAANEHIGRQFMFMKNIEHRGLSALAPGLYSCI